MDLIVLTSAANGLPVAVPVGRIIAFDSTPHLDRRGQVALDADNVPLGKGAAIILEGGTVILVQEHFDYVLAQLTQVDE